jgi:DNA modification methylase
MGKEWDKLEPNRDKQRWKNSDRKLIGDGSGKGGSFGDRLNELPSYIPKRNDKCSLCGKYRFSGTPCQCPAPEWENRTLEHLMAMQAWHVEWLQEVYRVLRPGAPVKIFSGSRTFHRLAAAMESVGFEIVRIEAWVYATGFPKSHDVSRAIDQHLGLEREKIRVAASQVRNPKSIVSGHGIDGGDRPWMRDAREKGYYEKEGDVPVSDQARHWYGWGTALKPAWEPFIVGRKPNA